MGIINHEHDWCISPNSVVEFEGRNLTELTADEVRYDGDFSLTYLGAPTDGRSSCGDFCDDCNSGTWVTRGGNYDFLPSDNQYSRFE